MILEAKRYKASGGDVLSDMMDMLDEKKDWRAVPLLSLGQEVVHHLFSMDRHRYEERNKTVKSFEEKDPYPDSISKIYDVCSLVTYCNIQLNSTNLQ